MILAVMDKLLRHVDLCSGIGGFALGFEWAGLSYPVMFCDIEKWSRQIVSKHWPEVPVATDVKELANDPDRNVPDCDILTAGYPCQPFSLAGERRGAEDDRHIWPDIFSIVQRKRPAWCVFENVYGHISMGLDEVLSDLELESYSVRPFIVPACATDAPHRRDRVWIIARNVADSDSAGLQGRENARDISQSGAQRDKQSARCSERPDGQNWLREPAVARVANGIPRRVDRIKGLGNAIVPQIAMRIGQTIRAVEEQDGR
jgi:DNA (cytosine-5)-methyltransferase 1